MDEWFNMDEIELWMDGELVKMETMIAQIMVN
jgi:hypothetical protein